MKREERRVKNPFANIVRKGPTKQLDFAGTIANVVVARKMKLDASQFVCLSMTTINKAYDFNS